LHLGTDIDYYKIVLPSGYNYSLLPRLHDFFNSGNVQSYTVDALFSYSTNGTSYSETFDDIVYSPISINNGGTVYFKVAPYFTGSTGTYLLEFDITRISASGIESIEMNAGITLRPNPASDFLTIDIHEPASKINRIALCDAQGRQLISKDVSGDETSIRLPLTEVPGGVYFVRVYSEKGVQTKKLIVKK
jgi:hypothetical protein